jgi:hypothetical protein
MKKLEHNVETGEITEREMNAQEIKQLEADKAKAEAEAEAKAQALLQRQALLEKLGITEDEAKLLLS